MRKKEIYFILIRHVLLLLFFIFAVLSFSANAGPNNPTNLTIKTTRLKNIARAKTCIFEQTPNYQHCTDMSDARQLTDGVYSKGYFWMQRSTVGWHRTNPVTFIIDLKAIMPISGVMFNTAAGVAGVRWPWAILIFVSNDLNQYQYVGNLIELDKSGSLPKLGKYSTHRFWTDDIAVSGRYVKFVVVPNGLYTFVDEVAVYKGYSGMNLSAPGSSDSVYETSTSLENFIAKCRIRTGIRRRLADDIESVETALKETDNSKPLLEALREIKSQVNEIEDVQIEGFSTEFPISELHKKIFEVQAAIWRKKGHRAITLWQKNRWDMVSPTEEPISNPPSIDLKMMRNEYRSAAFNITNTGEKPVKLNLTIEGLPGGSDPDYLKVYGGIFTDTAEGIPVMAALPTLDHAEAGYVMEIYPGLTRQVWLSVYSKNITPGNYTGYIKISPKNLRVPINVKIYPIEFPEKPRMHLGGWDYTNKSTAYDVGPENHDQFIEILKNYYVDTPWATRAVIPKGKYSEKGIMVKEPSLSNFRKWIQQWPNAENYSIFVSATQTFEGFPIGTSPFETALTQWINFWVEKSKNLNIAPEQLKLLLVDEPSNAEKSKIVIEYAKVIKRAQPKVKIIETINWDNPWDAPRELFIYSDILSPNMEKWLNSMSRFSEFYLKFRKKKDLWVYLCRGSSKLLDPYGYYLLPHWFCWKNDVSGICFWAWGDSGGSPSLNEYLAKDGGPFTPLFINKNSIIIGKHMEALREGIEDYEYLLLLQDQIDQLTYQNKETDRVKNAKRILASAVNMVTENMKDSDSVFWSRDKSRKVADKMREKILETICSLKSD